MQPFVKISINSTPRSCMEIYPGQQCISHMRAKEYTLIPSDSINVKSLQKSNDLCWQTNNIILWSRFSYRHLLPRIVYAAINAGMKIETFAFWGGKKQVHHRTGSPPPPAVKAP